MNAFEQVQMLGFNADNVFARVRDALNRGDVDIARREMGLIDHLIRDLGKAEQSAAKARAAYLNLRHWVDETWENRSCFKEPPERVDL